MQKSNTELLDELYNTSKMGLEAVDTLLPKVQDDAMRRQILSQRKDYEKTAVKASDMLQNADNQPQAVKKPMQKAMLWGSIQLNTAADTSTEHLAEMMVQGTVMGMVSIQKRLNELPQSDAGSRALAEGFLKTEQQHIDALKRML
jgi:hypothetical protein